MTILDLQHRQRLLAAGPSFRALRALPVTALTVDLTVIIGMGTIAGLVDR